MLVRFLILLITCCLCGYSLSQVKTYYQEIELSPNQELLYFPSGDKISAVNLSFDNVTANYLWFQTVNYFGKHYRSDQNYYWLAHMCDVVTDLDPKHKEIYEFCTLLIAWEANQPDLSEKIINKGIVHNDDYWRFYYLRGMNHMMFKDNKSAAMNDFITASGKPSAPAFIKRMAGSTLASLESVTTAIQFLEEMIKNSSDPLQSEALKKHLRKLIQTKNEGSRN